MDGAEELIPLPVCANAAILTANEGAALVVVLAF
jgi:hypothetical protein